MAKTTKQDQKKAKLGAFGKDGLIKSTTEPKEQLKNSIPAEKELDKQEQQKEMVFQAFMYSYKRQNDPLLLGEDQLKRVVSEMELLESSPSQRFGFYLVDIVDKKMYNICDIIENLHNRIKVLESR